ncbi:MAG: TonB-dependent receptor [Flavobacteriaceae bacterium]|nr:TonB-dependent receptor [Flavobacteriaceae bacterium]
MKYLFTLTFICACIFGMQAQNNQLKGTVIESTTGIPLFGANVIQKGTSNGVTTDFDGVFTISDISVGDVLEISYLGYQTKEVPISSLDDLTVVLDEDAAALEEVIVVGYGTQRRKEITGAVTVVGAETIEDLKPVRIEQALQGQVAGVQITSGSGAPGSGLNINIRGVSTNGDNRPLILLDGNVIEDLSVVNPTDIESINVLKDATAGIYGVRAANGVILITTKGGTYNAPIKFEVNSYGGFQETTREIPVLNATEYALLVNEARTNGGQGPLFNDVSNLGRGTDWQDEVFENAPIFNTDFSVTGGGENGRTSFNVGYLTQDGIVGGDKANFSRFTGRFTHDRKILKKIRLNSSILYAGTSRKSILENAIGSVLYNSLNNAPTFDVYDTNGEFSLAEGLGNEVINPVAQVANTFNRTRVRKLSGNLGLSYSFWDHFEIESRIQANYAEVIGFNFSPIAFYGSGKVFNVARNSVTESTSYFRDYTFDTFATYSNTFKEDHNLSLTLGTTIIQTTGFFKSQTGFDIESNYFGNATIENSSGVVNNFPNGGNRFDSRLLSYFFRMQYDFQGKYLFSGVMRRDGSTKFGPENKFGYFPSVSAGWIVSEEDFMDGVDAISFLKLRASYGIIGNDRIPDFRFQSTLNGEGEYIIDDELVFGSAIGALSNPEIKWEEQKTFDVGFDAQFLNDKLKFTFDYFNRRTEDLLVTAPVSGILGSAAPGSAPPTVNAGTVENKGFEVSLSYNHKVTDDFKYNISVNGSTIDNEVIFVNSENAFIPGGSFGVGQDFPSRMEAGLPIGYFRGFKTDGIFQTQEEVNMHAEQDGAMPGDIRFVDINRDGIISEDDKTYIGDPLPDATFGMNVGFEYKNIDFLAYAFASIGNDIVRNYERFQPLTNRTASYLDRWTGPGTSNDFPRVTTAATNNTLFSDFFVEDGSFLRVQNIQLGYTFSEAVLAASQIDDMRLYVSVANAFTFTNYKGYDPTASSGAPIGGGIDVGFYPNPRTYLIGMNFKF